ncbi:DNA-binding domain protein [Vibrio phage 1.240.O._10N.261.52.F8]|nr:DNA-binding domain protein [Vibrio phage 1.074.O._10N.222.49.B7]AUR97538.1 DNA-binding domain protein [Vibrio phage 1.240.O._10N.261.52.F8]
MNVDLTQDKIDRLKLKLAMKIKEHKDNLGLTQSDIASKARTTQPRVSKILNGDFYSVSVEDLIKINLRVGTGLRIIDLAEK